MATIPVLYSRRRCPYSMRVRFILSHLEIPYEIREIDLKNKPIEFMELAEKPRIPILVLPNGTAIHNSIDIMLWALEQQPESSLAKHSQDDSINDSMTKADSWLSEFAPALMAYKYPERSSNQDPNYDAREHCTLLLEKLEEDCLKENNFFCGSHLTVIDIILFPFIHKFTKADVDYFDSLDLLDIKSWHNYMTNKPAYDKSMYKYAPWKSGDKPTIVA